MRKNVWLALCGLMALSAAGAPAAERPQRWAVILEDPPLAAGIASRDEVRNPAWQGRRAVLSAKQAALRRALTERDLIVTGATDTLLNALFVAASEQQAAELRTLPGVRAVEELLPMKRHLGPAGELMALPSAWGTLGGIGNAGTGTRIGILDTGIDVAHPAFQDETLSIPAGFPKCSGDDCRFTNRKVIAARSYVDMLVLGNQPEFSRPDDLSPRDRVGHGTAMAMVAAGVSVRTPAGTINGVAPKAQLGNYKIFGSPGVNDVTFEDVLIRALEDAFNDGMDVVAISFGAPAVWGPRDSGRLCNEPVNVPCDWRAGAVENAARGGMAVVVSAGNDGDLGSRLPSLGTVQTPGTAPAAITVGASTNSVIYFQTVRVDGPSLPANLRELNALFGNGPRPANNTLAAPVRDVARLGNDGKACEPLANGSLNGAIALILRGDCQIASKVNFAQRAGAVGVLLYQQTSNSLFSPRTLDGTGIPLAVIGNRDGLALKSYIENRDGVRVTMDAAWTSVPTRAFDEVAFFSSQGPSLGEYAIKPELVAVGTDLFMATQTYDPNGELWDPSGYTVGQGTSFAGPIVAGTVAMVKQRQRNLNAAQLKSAVVNTADDRVVDFDENGNEFPGRVTGIGAGKLNAGDAVRTNVTVEPATLNFGVVGVLPLTRNLTIRNLAGSSVSLRLEILRRDEDPNGRLSLSSTTVNLGGGQSSTVTVRLEGSRPRAGSYEGFIRVTGGAVPLRIPFLYIVGDNTAYSITPLRGIDWVTTVGSRLRLNFKVQDRYGAPVANLPIRFRAEFGGGRVDVATERTDELGIGQADVIVGNQIGEQEFSAETGGLTVYFTGRARLAPTIESGGVVNAASGRLGSGVAPGSYVSIFGRGLSEAFKTFNTPYLPVSLAGVSVSFDLPASRKSFPGRIHFVSDGQVNVQVPWEFQGESEVLMKVSLGLSSTTVVRVPLNDYSPAAFEFADPRTSQLVAAALDEANRVVTTDNPMERGRVVTIYANGLGPVDNRPPSGEVTPGTVLSPVRGGVEVSIGGRPGEVLFAGLAPFNVGLYQINVRIPADTPTGVQPVVIRAGGVESKSANLPIR